MSRFTQPLFLIPLAHLDIGAKDNVFILMNPDFCFEVGHLGSEEKVCVPLGFITDLASVPAPLRPLVNPAGARISRAAVLHDFIYRSKEMREIYNRSDADRIMKDAMLAAGTTRSRAFIVWLTLRLFAWLAWHNGGKRTIDQLVVPQSELPTLFQNADKGLEVHGHVRLTSAVINKPLAK
jgi:hypothetical protein